LRVISRKALRQFWEERPHAKAPREDWYRVARRAAWQNLSEVRASYPHADTVGTCTVFNVRATTTG
jgi:mRNA interferase HigB